MPLRPLYRVERHFQHDLWPDRVPVAHVANLHVQELLGHGRDLGVGQSGVRLADIDELAGRGVQDGEGVVGKHALALAVAPFDRGHDHVERGERPLQLQPREAATPWRVLAVRILDHKALVAALARLRKDAIEVVGARRLLNAREKEGMLELERLEQASPLLQRFVEHGPIVDPQQVEDDQRHRNLAPELLVDDLATEAMLQLEKAKDASIAMGQHLAVEHHAVRESQRRLCELRKRGGRLFQVAREHLDAAVDVVQLAPHAVVLLLRPDLTGAHAVEGFLG